MLNVKEAIEMRRSFNLRPRVDIERASIVAYVTLVLDRMLENAI